MSEIKKMERIQEIDMAKGLLILLMVVFHLGLFNTKYPHTTQIVYAFHMSGFLLISGYLFSVNKEPQKFLRVYMVLSCRMLSLKSYICWG